MSETDGFADLLAERPDVGIGETGEDMGTPKAPPSPTALKLDDWSQRRGSELFYESELVQKSFRDIGVPHDPANDEWRHTGEYEKIKHAELATQDFHAAAFEPSPQLAENPKDAKISRYMKNLMETPEFKQLHDETCLDSHAAEIAAAHFAKQYCVVAKQELSDDDFEADMQCLSAVSQALAGATSEVQEVRDTEGALGMGSGNAGSRLPKEELRKRFERVRKSRDLARICQLAGRYRRMAQAMQRKKVLHGQDDMVGVTLGDNL
jgi:hypothetical protein